MRTIIPLRDFILVRRLEKPDTSPGGVALVQESTPNLEAEALSWGPDVEIDGLMSGDTLILYAPPRGPSFEGTNGTKVELVKAEDVAAKMTGAPDEIPLTHPMLES